MTLIFQQSGFNTALCSAYLYSQYQKFTENSFLYQFLTWMKSIFCGSYHLYRLFRQSTPLISVLGRVTIPPIFRRAVKVGQNFGHDILCEHGMTVKSAILCLSWLAGRLDCPQIR